MTSDSSSSNRPRLYRLNAEGKHKLLAKYSSPGGRQRFLEQVESVDRRTAVKVFEGEGVLRSKMEIVFADLDLILEPRDVEPIPNGTVKQDEISQPVATESLRQRDAESVTTKARVSPGF